MSKFTVPETFLVQLQPGDRGVAAEKPPGVPGPEVAGARVLHGRQDGGPGTSGGGEMSSATSRTR